MRWILLTFCRNSERAFAKSKFRPRLIRRIERTEQCVACCVSVHVACANPPAPQMVPAPFRPLTLPISESTGCTWEKSSPQAPPEAAAGGGENFETTRDFLPDSLGSRHCGACTRGHVSSREHGRLHHRQKAYVLRCGVACGGQATGQAAPSLSAQQQHSSQLELLMKTLDSGHS